MVTAPFVPGTTVLPALIARYLEHHQQVEVDLVLHDERLDL